MDNKKIFLISLIAIVIIVLFGFIFFFVKKIARENASVKKATPAEIKKDDTQAKNNGLSTPVLSPDSMGSVASSGQILSIAGDTIKIKDTSAELELKLSPATKIYSIEAPNPPALKDKSVLKEGASVLFEYDKGTLILNSILMQ